MNILGPDSLVFGVDDVAACIQYFTDYGLTPVDVSDAGGRFEAVDGTSIVIARRDDASLPAPMETGTMLRKTIYGVADRQSLDAIADELGRDREVKRLADGSIEASDDMGFVLGFQVSVRRKIDLPGEAVNSPGSKPARGPNVLGASPNAVHRPLTLSHVVYFVPDQAKGNNSPFTASGPLDAEGRYRLSTKGKLGVPAGWYKVLVTAVPPGTDDRDVVRKPVLHSRFTAEKSTPLSKEVVAHPPAGSYDLEVTRN